MAKFTREEKLNAVKRFLEGNKAYEPMAKEIDVTKSKLQFWVKRYKYHGESVFFKRYTNYTANFKLDVLNFMCDQGTSIFETAAIFNLPSDSILWNWKRDMEIKGWTALQPNKKGRPKMANDKYQKDLKKPIDGSVEELQQELEKLRMENAYLKKLNALVRNKEKSPNKTKRK